MHDLAENGIAAHWKYKDEDPQSLMREDRRLQWLREMVELFQEQKNPKEFLKNLKINLIPEEVYVFTPKGRVVSLPTGASALDFAFRIHTEIGLHSAGAKINGKSSPLKNASQDGGHRRDRHLAGQNAVAGLAEIAFTSGARHQIKRWLNQQEREKRRPGQKLWDEELGKNGLPRTSKGEALSSASAGFGLGSLARGLLRWPGSAKSSSTGNSWKRFHPLASRPGESGVTGWPDRNPGERRAAARPAGQCCRPSRASRSSAISRRERRHGPTPAALVPERSCAERMVEVSWGSVQADFKPGSSPVRGHARPPGRDRLRHLGAGGEHHQGRSRNVRRQQGPDHGSA